VPWCDGHSRKGVTRLDALVALARRWAPPSLERKSSQCTSKLLPARQSQPSIRLLDQGWQGPFEQWPGGRLHVRKCLQERDICEWRLRLGAVSIGTNCMQSMPIAAKQVPGQERKPHRGPQARPLLQYTAATKFLSRQDDRQVTSALNYCVLPMTYRLETPKKRRKTRAPNSGGSETSI
jgi:hypothetical protein